MLKQEGKKINLKISSYKTIKRNHDEISALILEKSRDKRRLKISKVYPKIESVSDIKVEMIRSASRLNMESEMLHHCVHSYVSDINSGRCAIYSILHNEERYTLEITAVKLPKVNEKDEDIYELKATQLRGLYNCIPPTSIEGSLMKLCDENNIIFDKEIKFKDKAKEVKKVKEAPVVKQKIEQIGVAVLDDLSTYIKSHGEELPF
jgi:hypothetical protein